MNMQPLVLSSEIGHVPVVDERRELFTELDRRAREIEALWKSTWSELADICSTMHDSQLWREGGYESFTRWLEAALPCSRSTVYRAMKLREELKDVPDAEIKSIPIGNAETLAQTPRNRRNGHLVERAKRQTPAEFFQTVVDSVPEAHLERRILHKFRFQKGASVKLQECFHMWKVLNDDPHAPAEEILEGIIAEYMDYHEQEYLGKLAGGEA